MSKKTRPFSRQKRAAIRERNIVGEWRRFIRWFLFSHDSFQRQDGALPRQRCLNLCRRYRCPKCQKPANACVHVGVKNMMFFLDQGVSKPADAYSVGLRWWG